MSMMPEGERALSSPDIGEHDNGSGKSETKSKTTHDGHKSLAFNLQQPRNPQPEAVCLACQSGPRRGFHRRLPVLMLLSGSHIASGPVCQVRKQGTRSIPVGPLARSLPVTCAVARSMSPGRRMAASGVEIGYLRRVPRRPPIERPFPLSARASAGSRTLDAAYRLLTAWIILFSPRAYVNSWAGRRRCAWWPLSVVPG